MSQFDIYEMREEGILTIDVQSDLVSESLDSRLVVPMFMPPATPWQFSRLTPAVKFEGTTYVLGTPLMTGLPKAQLRGPLGSLQSDRYTILNAIDFLLSGV